MAKPLLLKTSQLSNYKISKSRKSVKNASLEETKLFHPGDEVPSFRELQLIIYNMNLSLCFHLSKISFNFAAAK